MTVEEYEAERSRLDHASRCIDHIREMESLLNGIDTSFDVVTIMCGGHATFGRKSSVTLAVRNAVAEELKTFKATLESL